MNTLDCILTRRSVRRFLARPLEEGVIRTLVVHARFAPSWANAKEVRYLCVRDPALRAQVAALTGGNAPIIEGAPCLFVLTAVKGRSGQERDGTVYNHTSKEWTMFDGGLAAQALCLAAWELGVGTTILGAYDEPALFRLLDLPEDQLLLALIPAGYPAETPTAPRRKAVEEILRLL